MSALGRLIRRAAIKRQAKDRRKRAGKPSPAYVSRFILEPLEPRVLLSADVVAQLISAPVENVAGDDRLLADDLSAVFRLPSDVDSLMQGGIRADVRGIEARSDISSPSFDTPLLTDAPLIGESLVLTPTIKWNVDTDGFWDVASNWTDTTTGLNRLPTAADDVLIDRGAANPVITISTNQSVRALLSTEALVLSAGSLTLAAASELDGDFTLGGGLAVNGALTLAGNSSWTTGTIGGSQKLTNTGTLTLTGAATKSQIDFNIDNSGTMILSGGDLAIGNSFGNGGTLRNLQDGVIVFQGDGGIVNGPGGNASPHHFENAGAIRKTAGTGVSHITMFSFDNKSTGTIEVQAGTIQFGNERGMTNNGTFTVAAGAAIDLTGGGSFNYAGGFAGTGAGTVLLQNGAVNAQSSSLTFNFAPGLFQWTGGTINAGFGGILNNLGTMTLAGVDTKSFGGTLNNQGTMIQSGTGNLELFSSNVSTIVNNAGVYDLRGDGGFTTSGSVGGNRVNNSGTFRKSAGMGTSTVPVIFNNTGGAIDVASGTLALSGGGTDTGGTFSAASGAVLGFTGAARSVTGSYSGSGAGAVRLNTNLLVGTSGALFNFTGNLLQWIDGIIDGGSAGLTNVGIFTIAGATCALIGNLNNAGTIIHTGGNLQVFNDGGHGAILTNLAGGLYDIRGDGGIIDGGGDNGTPHLVKNLGTIQKSSGTGIFRLTPFTVINDGTINVQSGTLRLGGRSVSGTSGQFKVSAGAVLDLTGGSSTNYFGSFSGAGAGQIQLNGGNIRPLAPGLTLDFAPGLFQWTGGAITVVGITGFTPGTLTNKGSIILAGASAKSLAITLDNFGTFIQQGAGSLELSQSNSVGTINILPGGTYDFQGDGSVGSQSFASFINNAGTFKKSAGGLTSSVNASFTSTATVEVRSGSLSFSSKPAQFSGTTLTAGTWNVISNASLVLPAGTNVITNNANVTLSGAGSNFVAINSLANNTRSLSLLNSRNFTTAGALSNAGNLLVDSGSTLNVPGSYTQSAAASLTTQIADNPASGQFGKISSTGNAALDGAFNVVLKNGFGPSAGDSYTIMTFPSHTGSFAAINGLTLGNFTLFSTTLSATDFVLNGLTSSADLALSSVEILTTSASPGQDASVRYTVNNLNSIQAADDWYDSIYLSADNFLDFNDYLLGRVHHVGTVAGLGSYTETLAAPLPALSERGYRAIVLADSRGLVADPNRANNLAVSSATIAVTVPVLTLGGSVTATIADNQDRYYRLVVPPGEDVTIAAHYDVTPEAELYLRLDALPDRSNFDQAAGDFNDADPKLTLTNAAGGSYYILLHGREGAGSGQSFTLSAAAAPFELLHVNPDRVLPQEQSYIVLSGSGFTTHTTASLIAFDGTEYPATSVIFVPATNANGDVLDHLHATFDFSSIPLGGHSMRVQDGNQTSIASTVFRITNVISSNTSPSITVTGPEFIPVGGPAVVSISVENNTIGFIPSPLIQIDATGVVAGQETQQFIDPQLPEFLPPGSGFSLSIDYDPSPHAAHAVSNFDVGIADLSAVIDWDDQKDHFRPAGVSAEAWDAVWSNLRPLLRSTVADHFLLLFRDRNALRSVGVEESSIGHLLSFEIRKANNEVPFAVLEASTDLSFPAPGLPLQFGRSFLGSIVGRYQVGRLGRGWIDDFDIQAVTDPSGLITIRQGAVTRFFGHLTDETIVGAPGEFGTLTQVSGAYQLREKDGSSTAFRPDGSLDFIQDTNNNRITAGYTGALLTTLTHSNGAKFTLAYNAQGRLAQVTDPAGRTATYSYDSSGQHLLSITTPEGTTQYTYTAETTGPRAHALTSIADPAGSHLFYDYDAQGRVSQRQRDGGAEDLSFVYDINSYRIINAQAQATTIFYDDAGLTRKVRDALGNEVGFQYDDDHNLTAVVPITDIAGISAFYFDDSGNVTRTRDPLGKSVTYNEYDPNFNNLLSWSDTLNHPTAYGYDNSGNLTSTVYADGSAEQFSVDAQGNIVQSIDRRGQVIAYTYDNRGLLLKMQFPDGSHNDYDYDAHANLISATDARGTTTMNYDAADRMTKVTYPNGRFLSFIYDAGGRRTQSVDQSGFTVNYSYDAAGRLSALRDGAGNLIVGYTYDAIGNLTRKDDGNDAYTLYSYDAANQLSAIANFAPNNTLNSQFVYTYDELGRRQTETTLDGTTTYGYDRDGQLTSVLLPNGRSISYQYDAAGNRVAVTDNGVTTTYTTNNLNEYTSISGTNNTYDLAGNLVAASDANGNASYTYDALGRLIGVTNASGSWTYEYDALGNRIASVHNGQRTEYLIDPAGLGDVVGEYNGAGQLIAHYTHGIDLASRVDAGNTAAYYDFDAVGSTAGLTGANGSYLNRYSYLPFGETLSATETLANSFRFNGAFGVQNDGTGLNFMRARIYDAAQGRFIQPDPIGLASGANFYAFADNNPESFVDPSGLALTRTGKPIPQSPNNGAGTTVVIRPERPAGPVFTGKAAENLKLAQDRNAQRAQRELTLAKRFGAIFKFALEIIGIATIPLAIAQFGDEVYVEAAGDLPPCPAIQKLPFACTVVPKIPAIHIHDLKEEQLDRSRDPNDIVGPGGFGAEEFIVGAGSWPYIIDFENAPDAGAPAQLVVITDQLDSDLDLDTFQLGDFGFGGLFIEVPVGRQFYHTRLDLRDSRGVFVDFTAELDRTTRTVTWTLAALDPATLDLPSYFLIGFLPPDVTAPEGQGFVSYFVKPKANLPTGTKIDAQASIIFDINAPVLTNVFANTIDAGDPTSNVVALPAQTYTSSFNVNWAGTDDATGPSGSGIASFDVFVSDNGAAFSPFLTGTTLTTATFNGQFEHSYRFYSVANDNVGHKEAAPTIADTATITVSPMFVSGFTATPSGFVIDFNRPLDASPLNLYSTETGGFGPSDLTVIGNTQGPNGTPAIINGSLVVDAATHQMTFIQTGGILLPDTYTVTLRSAATGFKDSVVGDLLDGNHDFTTGDNYTATFTVLPSTAVVVSVPDFTRGAGQPVDVLGDGAGLPITLSDGTGVTSVDLTLKYNPALLTISGITRGVSLPATSQVQMNLATAGQARITVTAPTPLGAGSAELFRLTAHVPITAPYRDSERLQITDITINNGAIAAAGDEGIHVAAYFGDATGNGDYSSLDGQRVLRIAAGLDSGLASYLLIDPVVIADITRNGSIASLDATRILQEVAGLDRPEIPPLPTFPVPALAAPIAATDRATPTAAPTNSEIPLLTNDTTVRSADLAAVTNSLSRQNGRNGVAPLGLGVLDTQLSESLSKSTGKDWLFYTQLS